MEAIEIVVIIGCSALVLGVIISSILRHRKSKKTGDFTCSGGCGSCPKDCPSKTEDKEKKD